MESSYLISKQGLELEFRTCVCGNIYETNVARLQCSKRCKDKRIRYNKSQLKKQLNNDIKETI